MVLVMLIVGYIVVEQTVIFKHRYVLKQPTAEGNKAIITKAREFTDKKDGVQKWQLLKGRRIVPVPPAISRGLTNKGAFYVEAWQLEDGQIQYESHPKGVEGVEVATTNQRVMLANQFARAERDRRRGWQDIIGQIALPLGMFLVVAMVVIVGMVQWGEINKPGIEAKEIDKEIQFSLERTIKHIAEMERNIQIIGAEVGAVFPDTNQSAIPD